MSEPEPWPVHSRVWRDKEGYPWVEAGEPGSGRVFCYDGYLRRRMGTAWPAQDLSDASAEFGLVPLDPVPAAQEDRVVFLYAGGRSEQVHPGHPVASGRNAEEESFTEVIPGYEIALLSMGWYVVEDGECVEGAFVVVRRKR